MSAAGFEMPSSSGRGATTFRLVRTEADRLVLQVSHHSEFWPYHPDRIPAHVVPQLDVTASEVVSDRSALERLASALLEWTETRAPFALRLARVKHQRLAVALGPSPRWI